MKTVIIDGVKYTPCENFIKLSKAIKQLEDHFKYSIKDVNSYDELTDEEKKVVSIELYNLYKQ